MILRGEKLYLRQTFTFICYIIYNIFIILWSRFFFSLQILAFYYTNVTWWKTMLMLQMQIDGSGTGIRFFSNVLISNILSSYKSYSSRKIPILFILLEAITISCFMFQKLIEIGKKAFNIEAPREWNNLPTSLKSLVDL